MRKWKSSLLLAIMMVAALGQTASEMDSPQINRIAAKLKCSCGCNQNMACVMPPGCPVCKTNKAKMVNMQKSGMSDQQILDQYVAENGKDILVIPPGIAGVLRPVRRAQFGISSGAVDHPPLHAAAHGPPTVRRSTPRR